MNWNLRYANDRMPSHCPFCHGVNHLLRMAAYDPETKKGLPRPSDLNVAELAHLYIPRPHDIEGPWDTEKATQKAVDFHNTHCGNTCHSNCKIDQSFREGENNLKNLSFQQASTSSDMLLDSLGHEEGQGNNTSNKSKMMSPYGQNVPGRGSVQEHECIICGDKIEENEPSVRWKTQRHYPLKIIDREGGGVVPQIKGPMEGLKDYGKWQSRYENYLDAAQAKWKTTPVSEFNELSRGQLPEGQRDSNTILPYSTFADGYEPMHAKPCFKLFTGPYGCPAAMHRDPEDFEHGIGGKGHFKTLDTRTSSWNQRYAMSRVAFFI